MEQPFVHEVAQSHPTHKPPPPPSGENRSREGCRLPCRALRPSKLAEATDLNSWQHGDPWNRARLCCQHYCYCCFMELVTPTAPWFLVTPRIDVHCSISKRPSQRIRQEPCALGMTASTTVCGWESTAAEHTQDVLQC
ncbi:hypothetical protein ZWY2020_000579 [Hordeum vulgare]|nr:hypothetical protein ZWY2020_000579 [Hordeum vulgare]